MSYPERDPERTRALPPQEQYVAPRQHEDQYVAVPDEEVVSERVEDSRAKRLRGVGVACSVVSFVVGLFAVVLALHIVLTLAEANAGNGFASFVRDFSGAVSLGFEGLFSPGSQKLAVLLDYGMAIIVWLLIGAAVNFLIRRFFTPGVNREVKYRRRIT